MLDIILACHNGRKYLKTQIDSILAQDYEELRLLIRDDGSNDGSRELLLMYEALHPGKIVLIRDEEETSGASQNFFRLMKASDADYIMFADQDDFWEEWKVSKAVKCMKKAEKSLGKDVPILCHGDPKVVDERLNTISASLGKMQKLDYKRHELRDYLVQNNITGCTMIINKKLNELCDVMPEEAIMHDWWLALIASAFGRVFYMGEAGVSYRQHAANVEGAKNFRSPVYVMKRMFDKKSIKESLNKTYAQAEVFYEHYFDSLEMEQAEMIAMYFGMKDKKKLGKLMTKSEYKFYLNGFARKVGYFIYL